MRARAAEIEAANRRAISRCAEKRPRDEKLIERHFAVERMAASEAVRRFEIGRRDDVAAENFALEVGRVRGKRFDDGVAESLSLAIPIALLQAIRRVLHVD